MYVQEYPSYSQISRIQVWCDTQPRNPVLEVSEASEALFVISYLAMSNCIGQSLGSQLALIACAVPDLAEERMPWWYESFMEDTGRATAIVLLDEIRAVPTCLWVELILVRIEIIRSPLWDYMGPR